MRERFKPEQLTIRANRWQAMSAIATPVLLGMVAWLWLIPDRQLHAYSSRPSPTDGATIANQHREPSINGVGAIATVIGGALLLLNFRIANRSTETDDLSGADFSDADLSGVDLKGANLSGANLSGANLSGANLCGADLSSADLSGANLCSADLSGANLSGANLCSANLNGANLNSAELRYANLSGAELRYTNLGDADFRYANLSGADLNCAFLCGANFCDADLSSALLFYINSRDVLNLEPLQLEAKPSPFLCHVALPSYSHQPDVDPNRDCDRIPQLLSARYDISLEEAQGIVDEARQHPWDT